MDLTDGCLYRYNTDAKDGGAKSDVVSNTVVLKASGNYTGSAEGVSKEEKKVNKGIVLDSNSYGKWLNTNLRIKPDQKVSFTIKGEVSLCKAYIPKNNLQQDSDLDVKGNRIEIPRVEDKSTPPVSLVLDAKTPNWKNLTELYFGDKYYVAIHTEKKTPSALINDVFTKTMRTADCSDGQTTYNPICGKYSLWSKPDSYVGDCKYVADCIETGWECISRVTGGTLGWPWSNSKGACHDGSADVRIFYDPCYQNVFKPAPEPYSNAGRYPVSLWKGVIADLYKVTKNVCTDQASSNYMKGKFQSELYFWFSAGDPNINNGPVGLLTRIDSSVAPTNAAKAGSIGKDNIAKREDDQSFYNNSPEYKIIKIEDKGYSGGNIGYLQYKLAANDGAYDHNTGGFVLNIKQTKCIRKNGDGKKDSFEGRGAVQYVISDYGSNPNTTAPTSGDVNIISVSSDGAGSITAPANGNGGYLWLKISNKQEDYQDSIGQYTVSFLSSVKHGGFYDDVLNPLFEGLKTKIKTASITIFKNMTCYKGIGGRGSCTNFFNYIRGLLSLYIMAYGAMFLLGMVKISQTDLVIRVVKIALVSGLMNDKTFDFFNNYVFDFVTGFSDNIIANMSGYSLFSNATSVSNPFMFMNEVFTKIFLSSTFAAQMMSLLSMGMNGVIYFILMFVCIGVIIVVGFRAIAVYLMAYFAIAVLIGISPLFLTFILFERTRYLFDNWVKFTFRYMLEPVIMLAGIIILTQLFTIYLDYVIGYSVCWKCAIPFRIPFPHIKEFNPAFLDVPLFCFNWFAPWGFDYRSSSMGLNMQNMVIMLMIVYCMWGYIEFSGKMVARLAGGSGGPSATGMGADMSGAIENKALTKIGLDRGNRERIKSAATERLKSVDKSTRRGTRNLGGNRYDQPAEGDEGKSRSKLDGNVGKKP